MLYVAYAFAYFFIKYHPFDEEWLKKWFRNFFRYGSITTLYILKFNLKPQWIQAIISWWFFAWVIIELMDDLDAFPFAYASVIFYSEYYELPFYLWRYSVGLFWTKSVHPIWIAFRLIAIFIMVYQLEKMGEGTGKKYFIHMIKFTLPYLMFGWLLTVANQPNNMMTPIILKFICLIDLIYFIWCQDYERTRPIY